jgi:hypothetical protein
MKDAAQQGRESAGAEASACVGMPAQSGIVLARTESLVEKFDTRVRGLCESVHGFPRRRAQWMVRGQD